MKSKAVLLAALCSLAFWTMGAQTLPESVLEDAAGKAVKTSALTDGKTPFAITFWASWCEPCKKELAALTEAAPDWEGKFPMRIYAICVDDVRSIQRAKSLAHTGGWPVTVLYDKNSDLARTLGVSSIPHVFVFDKNGKQVFTHMGYIPGDEETLMEQLLKAGK